MVLHSDLSFSIWKCVLFIFSWLLILSALCDCLQFPKKKIISKWKPYFCIRSKSVASRFGSAQPWNVRKMSDLCYFIRNEMKSRQNFYPIYYSQIIRCTLIFYSANCELRTLDRKNLFGCHMSTGFSAKCVIIL